MNRTKGYCKMTGKCWACDAPTIIIRTIETCTRCKKKWYTLEQWENKVIYNKVVTKLKGDFNENSIQEI